MPTAAALLTCAAVLTQVASATVCSEPSCPAYEAATASAGASAAALVQRERRSSRSPPLSCAARGRQNCAEHPLCSWSKNLTRCQARIAWFHVMKCGSTFGATLAHFANSSLPPLAHMPTCTGKVLDEKEDNCTADQQGPGDFFHNHYPMKEWFPETFWTNSYAGEPGGHRAIELEDHQEWKGHFVGLFRSPQSRVASAYNHFIMNSENTSTFVKDHAARYMLKFARVNRGMVTKMLSGRYHLDPIWCEFHFDEWISKDPSCESANCSQCLKQEEPSDTTLQLAERRLRGFAFVGLTEYFDLSVCLFHTMFGGECRPAEFVNMRRGVYNANYTDILAEHEFADPFDEKIFQEASGIFWSNVAQYQLTAQSCSRICPHSNATFEMPSFL